MINARQAATHSRKPYQPDCAIQAGPRWWALVMLEQPGPSRWPSMLRSWPAPSPDALTPLRCTDAQAQLLLASRQPWPEMPMGIKQSTHSSACSEATASVDQPNSTFGKPTCTYICTPAHLCTVMKNSSMYRWAWTLLRQAAWLLQHKRTSDNQSTRLNCSPCTWGLPAPACSAAVDRPPQSPPHQTSAWPAQSQ